MVDSFGEMVKRARLGLGWTQRDLACRLGVGQQAVSGWERGMSRPYADVVPRVAELLGLDIDSVRTATPLGNEWSTGYPPPNSGRGNN